MQNFKGLTRRQFGKLALGLGAASLLESNTIAWALTQTNRLSWRAYAIAGGEGQWNLNDIEGVLPPDLAGTLIRVTPGQKETYGTELKHVFDGDAYVSKYTFRNGKVDLLTKFIDTPQRLEEIKIRKMLYNEFGTFAPDHKRGKNQGNVNIIQLNCKLLALSEGGHPTEIDINTLAYKGGYDFQGKLPPNMSFTAHPKFDPNTGEGFAYGIKQGAGLTLTVYRIAPDGTLNTLHAIDQSEFYMIHDMMVSKEYITFIIPPARYDLLKLITGLAPLGEALGYFEKEPTRILIMRRDGMGQPVTINLPANLVFHHGNAFEKGDQLVLDSLMTPDDSILKMLYSWSKDQIPTTTPTVLTRFVVDPIAGNLISRTEICPLQEFPRFDTRQLGSDYRYLYTLESANRQDPLLTTALVRHDMHTGNTQRIQLPATQTLGEVVFVPRPGSTGEDQGWLLAQGFDGLRDQIFLDIRDAETLDLAARIWTHQHFPIGFHGNFIAG